MTESLLTTEQVRDIAVGVAGVAGSLALAPFGFPGEEAPTEIIDRLEAWGCEDIDGIQTERYGEEVTQIDFTTPLPGDDPMKSSMTVDESNQVARGEIRFGVLDGDAFFQNPSRDPQMIRQLHSTMDIPGKPQGHVIYGHFGNVARMPRPHLMYGWEPRNTIDMHIVENGDPDRRMDVFEFIDYIEMVGRRMQRSFRREWDN